MVLQNAIQDKSQVCETIEDARQNIESIRNELNLLLRTQQIEEHVQQIDIETETTDILRQLDQFKSDLQAIENEIPIENESSITIRIRNILHERTEHIAEDIANRKKIVLLMLQARANKKKMKISISLTSVFILINLFSVLVITNSQLNFVNISLFNMISNKLLLIVSSSVCALFAIAAVAVGIYIHNIIKLNNQNNLEISEKQNSLTQTNETQNENSTPDPSKSVVDQAIT
jgi:hypothetical protein